MVMNLLHWKRLRQIRWKKHVAMDREAIIPYNT